MLILPKFILHIPQKYIVMLLQNTAIYTWLIFKKKFNRTKTKASQNHNNEQSHHHDRLSVKSFNCTKGTSSFNKFNKPTTSWFSCRTISQDLNTLDSVESHFNFTNYIYILSFTHTKSYSPNGWNSTSKSSSTAYLGTIPTNNLWSYRTKTMI